MSTMANERNTTAEGLIKHILAHEAHRGIDDRLLALRKEDNAVDIDVVYSDLQKCASQNDHLSSKMLSNGVKNNHASFDFASKFTVNTSGVSNSSESRSTQRRRKVDKKSSNSKGSHHSNDSSGSSTSKHASISKRQSDCESIAELASESIAEVTKNTD